jgi:hypothetical protein
MAASNSSSATNASPLAWRKSGATLASAAAARAASIMADAGSIPTTW